MKPQTLTLRPNDAITIPTPCGLIRIFKNGRKLRFELPDGLKAFIGEERALNDSPFLAKKNGKIVPKFHLLTAVVNPEGELIGVQVPQILTLGD